MIEVEVHQQLRQLLRQSPEASWPHQLTMARLVARGLRLGRSALIQVPAGDAHRLSYLLPALMWAGPTLICASATVQAQILASEIPWLQQALQLNKPVQQAARWPGPDFAGVLLADPVVWLRARLRQDPIFPTDVPVLIDGAERLATWGQQALTLSLWPEDWSHLQRALPLLAEPIARAQVDLTLALLRRSPSRFLLHSDELERLAALLRVLPASPLPDPWSAFRAFLAGQNALPRCLWAEVQRDSGRCLLHLSPTDLSPALDPIWGTQPFVLIGEALDLDRQAPSYRQSFGVPEATTLRFSAQVEAALPVYLPMLPVPNSPCFRDSLQQELKRLICLSSGSVVVLTSDQPLQAQVGTALAAEFGSRVRVNLLHQNPHGILVCGWEYWLDHRYSLPQPDLLAVATLPFPSMEDPLVAGRVEQLKRLQQDWFRAYLLPTAVSHLLQAVAPLRRDEPGMLALLDSRILCRSYGALLLEALGAIARISSPPTPWENRRTSTK